MENHKNPFAVFSLKYPKKDKLGGTDFMDNYEEKGF